MSPRLAVAFLVLLSASPSSAARNGNGNGGYKVSARVRTGVEHVGVYAPGGKRENTTWKSAFTSNARGPLLSPLFGTASAMFLFEEGDNPAQVVSAAGRDAGQQKMAYMLRADLLPPEARRYIRFSPRMSRTQDRVAWLGSEVFEYTDNMIGASTGLSLPRLPVVDLGYEKKSRRENDGLVSPFDRDTFSSTQDAVYVLGPLHWDLHRRTEISEPLYPGMPEYRNDTVNSSADFSKFQLNWNGVRDVFVRTTYHISEGANSVTHRNRNVTENAQVTSESVKVGGMALFVRLGQSFGANLERETSDFGHDASLHARAGKKAWSLQNQIRYRGHFSPGRPSSVGDILSVSSAWYGGVLRHNMQGEESYAWGGRRGDTMSDALLQRLTLIPHRVTDVYVEFDYRGTRPEGGPIDSWMTELGGGGTLRPVPGTEARVSVRRRRARVSGVSPISHRDYVSLGGRTTPLPRLKVDLTYSFQLDTVERAGMKDLKSGTLDVRCAYSPVARASLSANIQAADLSRGGVESQPLNAGVSGSYRFGRTVMSAHWERREVQVPDRYNRMGLSLTRDI